MTLLDRCNPVARMAAAVVVTTPLFLTLDWLSASVSLGLALLGLLVAGIRPSTMLRRCWPLLLLAPISAISMLLYAAPSGHEFFGWGPIHVTEGSIRLAIATMVRTLALSVPVVLLVVGLNATEVADGLAQVVRLPARFVLGTLAGMRMLSLFVADWHTLGQARRARGLGDAGAIRRFVSMAFALLVFALRRGQKLATAMEARGFGSGPRTWARESRVGWPDAVLLLVAAAIVGSGLLAAAVAGTWFTPWVR